MKLTNYLGVFASLDAVWQSYPGGGLEGDYVLVGSKVYGWNIFEKNWTMPDIAPSMSEVRKTQTVYGDMHVHHDLSVGGILRARVVRGRNAFCGLFASAAALEKHYADPYIGQWALVAFDNRTDNDGNAIGKIYVCEQDGIWKDSGVKGGYDGTLYEALQTEREERMEVDADLIVLISNEIQARQDADAVLQKNIDAEAKLRQEADAVLQGNIDAEARARQEADATLQKNIEAEARIRHEADVALQANIDAEAKARENAIADIQGQFDALVGENASEAINNFNEVLSFLSGIKDTETLVGKIAEIKSDCDNNKEELQGNIDELEEKHDEDIERLSQAIWPLEVSLSVSPSVIEVNAQTSVRLSWSVKRKGVAVTPESQRLDGEAVTGTSKSVTLQPETEGTQNFTYEATYEKMTKSVEAGVKAVYASYFGVVPVDWEPSAEKVALLTKSIQASRSMRKDGLKFGYSKICYCYPASFGALTSIKDGNGYEVIESYTRTTLEIGGVSYLCYVLTNAVSVDNVTQIFS